VRTPDTAHPALRPLVVTFVGALFSVPLYVVVANAFKPGADIQSAGKNYYTAPKDSEIPATKAEIREGMLESSNVNPIASAVDLITTQRYSDLMQRALSLFDAQFNRIATEDLPRIS